MVFPLVRRFALSYMVLLRFKFTDYGGRKFIVVGCVSGIYLAHYGTERAPLSSNKSQYLSRFVEFRKVLNEINPASISALQTLGDKTFNKLVVHADAAVFSYSLETIVRVGLGHAHPQTLEVVAERIGGSDNNIPFCKHLQLGHRLLRRFSFLPTLTSALTLVLNRFFSHLRLQEAIEYNAEPSYLGSD